MGNQNGEAFGPSNAIIANQLLEIIRELDRRGFDIAAAHAQMALDTFVKGASLDLPPEFRRAAE